MNSLLADLGSRLVDTLIQKIDISHNYLLQVIVASLGLTCLYMLWDIMRAAVNQVGSVRKSLRDRSEARDAGERLDAHVSHYEQGEHFGADDQEDAVKAMRERYKD